MLAKRDRNRLPIAWVNVAVIGGLHLGGIYALVRVAPHLWVWPVAASTLWLAALTVALAWITGIGITMGYHRKFTHSGFKSKPWLDAALLWTGGMAWEGPAMKWVADHRLHHERSDETRHDVIKSGKDPTVYGYDPHSPYEYPGWRGVVWAHFGWLFVKHDYPQKRPKDLEKIRMFRLQDRYYLLVGAFSLLLPLALAGWDGFWVAGVLRVIWVYNITWMINSITHVFGRPAVDSTGRTYVGDQSGNLGRLAALITFGESYHANHHARQAWAAHGLYRDDLDVTASLIRLLELSGAAWSVRWPKAGFLYSTSVSMGRPPYDGRHLKRRYARQ